VTALIRVDESTRKPRAWVPPKVTAVAPVKLRPVMVTVIPPPLGPRGGLMAVTVGVLAATTTCPTVGLADTPVADTPVTAGLDAAAWPAPGRTERPLNTRQHKTTISGRRILHRIYRPSNLVLDTRQGAA
jgi:hypothetical protein